MEFNNNKKRQTSKPVDIENIIIYIADITDILID